MRLVLVVLLVLLFVFVFVGVTNAHNQIGATAAQNGCDKKLIAVKSVGYCMAVGNSVKHLPYTVNAKKHLK